MNIGFSSDDPMTRRPDDPIVARPSSPNPVQRLVGNAHIPPLDPTCHLRLILMRHGKPTMEAKERCYGRLDVSLSLEGQEQLRNKIPLLQSLQPGALYTSASRRAVESAETISHELNLRPEPNPDLSEINFGDFEGLTYQEIETRYPREYRQWIEEPTGIKFPGGESFADVKSRALNFLSYLFRVESGQTVLAISHSGVNRYILANALGMPQENLFRIDQQYGAVNVIDYYPNFSLVRLVNG
jgi:alpha-ribazole phosphatase